VKAEKTFRGTDELRRDHGIRGNDIRNRLSEFRAVPDTDYFYELAYCLLTPQSSAVHAGRVVDRLAEADFLGTGGDPTHLLRAKEQYIRFHNTKARRLLEARSLFPAIRRMLGSGEPAPAERTWLVTNVKGLGWKEASHFLRNIGRRDLAILDRHILRNLARHGVIRTIPSSLTPSRYRAIEERFARFAQALGIPMDELDLLFWSRETGEILK
jgi:N-glycosylase/DNA lyase